MAGSHTIRQGTPPASFWHAISPRESFIASVGIPLNPTNVIDLYMTFDIKNHNDKIYNILVHLSGIYYVCFTWEGYLIHQWYKANSWIIHVWLNYHDNGESHKNICICTNIYLPIICYSVSVHICILYSTHNIFQ